MGTQPGAANSYPGQIAKPAPGAADMYLLIQPSIWIPIVHPDASATCRPLLPTATASSILPAEGGP